MHKFEEFAGRVREATGAKPKNELEIYEEEVAQLEREQAYISNAMSSGIQYVSPHSPYTRKPPDPKKKKAKDKMAKKSRRRNR